MAYTRNELIGQLENLGVCKNDTLLVHSSMKAIGAVEGGAETVLDALIEVVRNGLLIFPTHTWATVNADSPVYDPATEPSCVGILSNLYMKRSGVVRSWHPTHSVAALGAGAAEFVSGEENWDTPCHRNGCWGKLYDRGAKIMFIGCSLNKNTIIHGVEEWNQISDRLTEHYQPFKIKTPDGAFLDRPLRTHDQRKGDISENYGKIEAALVKTGIARLGMLGEARTHLCEVRPMVELVSSFLQRNPDLFADQTPIPSEWY